MTLPDGNATGAAQHDGDGRGHGGGGGTVADDEGAEDRGAQGDVDDGDGDDGTPEIAPEPTGFLRRHVFSTDHKVIGKQFLFLGLGFLAVGGIMAMLIRWQLARPGAPVPIVGRLLFPRAGGVISPAAYTALFTMHGTIMIFFAVTPILISGFGNFCVPLLIGARDMAFPRLNLASFWTLAAGTAVLTASFFVPLGPPQAGWTAYATLSTAIGAPGVGQTLWVVAIYLNGASSVMGAVNYITTVIRLRAPGMTYLRLPLTVWGFFLTSILNALFVPVLAAAMVLLFFDRVFGTQFFTAGSTVGAGGDPILYQHLFWLFGHPEVYILILPAWGIVSDLLSFFARKPAFGYRVTVYSLIGVVILSAVVYGHHMFTTGLSPLLGEGFMMLTMIVSLPTSLLYLNWLGTLWRGAARMTTPMLFCLGLVFTFGVGGLTGLYLADVVADMYLHDTYFVVGHFHLIMAAALLFASFAAVYFWFPKMFGRLMSERLGKLHFWPTFVTLNLVFMGQLLIGYAGMQRRLYDPSVYDFLRPLLPLNRFISRAAYVLGASQLIFVVNFFGSLFYGARATKNPWQVGTLEWTVSSPPPHHNFDRIPLVLRGPHELGHPAAYALGKDWLGQD
ncbi:MAG TPA: cbb3-type cytochrome c oxidase subunit I, partial [Polyangia bacterium]|nr:cbb3-type cytochrome c oxidase subunit I [Polyangia bacterium]